MKEATSNDMTLAIYRMIPQTSNENADSRHGMLTIISLSKDNRKDVLFLCLFN